MYLDDPVPTQGLADLAHNQASGENEDKFCEVDLDDSAQVILRGVTEEQHQKHRQELSRLQALYVNIVVVKKIERSLYVMIVWILNRLLLRLPKR